MTPEGEVVSNENTTPETEATAAHAPEATSPESALTAQVAELGAQLKDKENKYLYLYAEFETYKKRAFKERQDAIKFGWESVARELLQVLDNLERGMAHVPAGTDKGFVMGLELVCKEYRSTLEKQGVTAVPALNLAFDPNVHEAVGQEASPLPQGTIIREESRGYTLHGRLLRPARVIVSRGN